MSAAPRTTAFDAEVDVLVVGAGACGLVAALAAHEAGAEVAVLEKLDRPGGNSALSSGSVPGAGTRFQREAGIEDSPQAMLDDLLGQSGPHGAEPLSRVLCAESAGLVEWLVDRVGVDLRLITEYRHVGHSVPRLHAPPSRRGADLVAALVRALEQREIPLAVGNPVRELIVDAAGTVGGALVAGERTEPTRIGAAKVILAANGFAANRAMLREFCPEIAAAEYFGAHGSTGEAIEWGIELGAASANMAAFQGYAAVAYPHGSLLSWTVVEKGGLIVNQDGERFGDESKGYSGFAADVLAQGGLAQVVFDARIRDFVAGNEEEFAALSAAGGVRLAAGAGALAALAGLPADRLERTLRAAAEAAASDQPDAFGRRDFGFGSLTKPYAICQVRAGLFHTQGGLLVDDRARVLDADRRPIPNLLAGGGTAAGISGSRGGSGYSSGNGLLTAMGLGRIAGATAAAELAGDAGGEGAWPPGR